jgi:hypothetical protein
MIKLDEINDNIEFINVFTEFPEYFTLVNEEIMLQFTNKWSDLGDTYLTVEDALTVEYFTLEEIDEYALWRTIVYYATNPPETQRLKRRIFLGVLKRFTQYYRNLAGRSC